MLRFGTNLLLLLSFFSTELSAWEKPLVPKTLGELGFISAAPALTFTEGTHLIYFRPEQYLKRHPHLRHLPPAELKRIALLNAAYLTQQQLKWDGILMKVEKTPTHSRIVFSGGHDGRASHSGILTEEELLNSILPPLGTGLSSRKGTGITPTTESRQAIYIAMVHVLKGEPVEVDITSEEARGRLRKNIEGIQETIKEYELMKDDAGWEVMQSINREIAFLEQDLALLELYEKGLLEKDTLGKPKAETALAFVDKLAGKDYTNGLIEAARGLVEAMLFEIYEEVYHTLNEVWGTSLGVVEVDLVAALPVKMHSISYGGERYAGVIERGPQWRGQNQYDKEGELRYWTPTDIIHSEKPLLEQVDVNGRNIDLELMIASVPGLDEYFRAQYRQFYGRELHALCIEATEAAMKGDETAVPHLIAKLKGSIRKDELMAWAKTHRPPKNFGKDPFSEARQIFNRLERSDETHGGLTPATSKDLVRLRIILTQLRKSQHADQITALWPNLFRRAPTVAKSFWDDTMQLLRQHLKTTAKKLERAEKSGKKVTIAPKNLTYLGDLLSMMLFHWQGLDSLAPMKYEYALSLFKADVGMFAEMYSAIIPEFYRRVYTAHGLVRNDFFQTHSNYQLGVQLFGRLAIAMMLEMGAPSEAPVSIDEVLGEVEYLEHKISFSDALRVLAGNDAEGALLAIEAVEHALGLQIGDRFIRRLFPDHAPRIQLHLGMQRAMEQLSPSRQLACLMELAGAAGEVDPDQLAGIREALAPGGLLSGLLDRGAPPTQGLLPPGPTPPKKLKE